MKLFQFITMSMVSAKSLERASALNNLPMMDPDDPSYTMKTKALLGLLGIDIEEDPYFDVDGEVSDNVTYFQF